MKTLNNLRCGVGGMFDSLWCRLFKKCPAPVCPCEPKKCEQLRAQLAAASPIDLPDGSQFVFINQLLGFTPSICPEGTPPTVEQLAEISKALKVDGCYLCPMLVWATQNGTPVLAWVKPGYRRPVEVVCTPSLCCRAYIICVIEQPPEVWITLVPGASYQVTSSSPSITTITFEAKTDPGVSGGTISALVDEDELWSTTGISSTPETFTASLGAGYPPSQVTLKNTGTVTVYIRNVVAS